MLARGFGCIVSLAFLLACTPVGTSLRPSDDLNRKLRAVVGPCIVAKTADDCKRGMPACVAALRLFDEQRKVSARVAWTARHFEERILSQQALCHQLAGEVNGVEKNLRQVLSLWKEWIKSGIKNGIGSGDNHPDDPEYAKAVADLAYWLHSKGKFSQAERYYWEALALHARIVSLDHPDYTMLLNSLVAALLAQDKWAQAIDLFEQALMVRDEQTRYLAGEAKMSKFLSALRFEEMSLYSLLLRHSERPEVVRLALTNALLRKGRVAEAGAILNWVRTLGALQPRTRAAIARWKRLHLDYLGLMLHAPRRPVEHWLQLPPGTDVKSSPTDADVERERRIVERLRKRQETHAHKLDSLRHDLALTEESIMTENPELRVRRLPQFNKLLPSLAASLPKNGVLIELLPINPINFTTQQEQKQIGKRRYVALLLFPDGHVSATELGDVEDIEKAAAAMMDSLQNERRDPRAASRRLHRLVFRHFESQLVGMRHIYLSPEGVLNLIPFAALHDGKDYLISRFEFHYLTSGRDILYPPAKSSSQSPLVIADPDLRSSHTSRDVPATLMEVSRVRSFQDAIKGLGQLPGAREEGRYVAELLSSPLYEGPEATELLLHRARAPRILHIASHGVFLAAGRQWKLGVRGNRSQLAKLAPELTAQIAGSGVDADSNSDGNSDAEDPMIRSALILAGAQRATERTNPSADGVLTAEEVTGLNLWGTKLVVLSACESGRGALSSGQGVYGLRRAFLIAGAETLVTSLWKVSDSGTSQLMQRYYELLVKQNRGRVSAMHEAMIEVRKQPGRAHPFYWAPFLVIGQDGPLTEG